MAVCPKENDGKGPVRASDNLPFLFFCYYVYICSFNAKAGSLPVVQLAAYDVRESIKQLTCSNHLIHFYSLLLHGLSVGLRNFALNGFLQRRQRKRDS